MDQRTAKAMAERLVKIAYEQNRRRPTAGYYTCDVLNAIDKDTRKVHGDISRVLAACMAGRADNAAMLAARRLDEEHFPKDLRMQDFLHRNVKCPAIISNPGG